MKYYILFLTHVKIQLNLKQTDKILIFFKLHTRFFNKQYKRFSQIVKQIKDLNNIWKGTTQTKKKHSLYIYINSTRTMNKSK